jgi:hypothetical protein
LVSEERSLLFASAIEAGTVKERTFSLRTSQCTILDSYSI